MRKKIAALIVIGAITVALATFLLLDIDGDGLSNFTELRLGTSINDSDTDSDGLNDGLEVNTFKTDPFVADTDNDNLDDGPEVNTYGTNPLSADTDEDGLNDGPEVNIYGTNPLKADTDDDNLDDGLEVNTHGTDPLKADTDNDGLSDWSEINTHGSDPKSADTDNDGLSDGLEVSTHGTDPLDNDTDNDKLLDGLEINGWSITVNGQTLYPTSDAFSADTDGDGLNDWAEYHTYHSDPRSADTDDDGLSDKLEVVYATDLADSSEVTTQLPGGPDAPRLLLEIDYMTGYEPSQEAMDYLESYFEDDLAVAVEITCDEVTWDELTSIGVSPDSLDGEECTLIEGHFHDNPTTHVYVFYAKALEGGETGGWAGDSYGAFLKGEYVTVTAAREKMILLHEIGHAITSVGAEHCDNPSCVMQSGPILESPVFCESCWGKRNLIDKWSVDEPWL